MAGKKGGIEAGRAYVKAWLDDSDLQKGLTKIESGLKGFGSKIAGIGKGFAAFGGGIVGAFLPAIKAAADAEKAAVGFEVLLGSAAKAKQVMQDLNKFAASTPFELPELNDATRKLLAFGVTQENLIPTLRAVGDVSAGIGAPIGEIAEIYGKAKVQGRLFMEDINQLTGRGIPIIQELAKQFGVAESEVRGLVEKGQVNFTHLEAAFQSLTGEGGKFGGMMQRMSETTAGKWSTLMDTIAATGRSIGGALLPVLKPAMDQITTFAERVAAWAEQNQGLTATVFKVGAAVAAIGAALTGFGYAFTTIASAVGAAKTAIGLLSAVSLPALGAALGAVAIGYFAYQVYQAQEAIRELNRQIAISKGLDQRVNRQQERRRSVVTSEAASIQDPEERKAFLAKALEQAETEAKGARASASGAQTRFETIEAANLGVTGIRALATDAKLIDEAEGEAKTAAANADAAERHVDALRALLDATSREGQLAAPSIPGNVATPQPTTSGDGSTFLSAWNTGVDKLVDGIEGAAATLGLVTPKLSATEWFGRTFGDAGGDGASIDGTTPDTPSLGATANYAINRAVAVGSNEGMEALYKAMQGGPADDATASAVQQGNKTLASIDKRLANQKTVVITEGQT